MLRGGLNDPKVVSINFIQSFIYVWTGHIARVGPSVRVAGGGGGHLQTNPDPPHFDVQKPRECQIQLPL